MTFLSKFVILQLPQLKSNPFVLNVIKWYFQSKYYLHKRNINMLMNTPIVIGNPAESCQDQFFNISLH
jgi:hypothetical protein